MTVKGLACNVHLVWKKKEYQQSYISRLIVDKRKSFIYVVILVTKCVKHSHVSSTSVSVARSHPLGQLKTVILSLKINQKSIKLKLLCKVDLQMTHMKTWMFQLISDFAHSWFEYWWQKMVDITIKAKELLCWILIRVRLIVNLNLIKMMHYFVSILCIYIWCWSFLSSLL